MKAKKMGVQVPALHVGDSHDLIRVQGARVNNLKVAESSAPAAAQGRRAPARMRFESMDRNRDGQISRDEWRGSDRSFLAHDWNELDRPRFANLDHDRNRQITPDEWHYDGETFTRADRKRDGALDRAEFVGGDMDADRGDRFEDLDVDRDGRVERGEWHVSDDAFSWLDCNRDGALSRVAAAARRRNPRPCRTSDPAPLDCHSHE